MTTVGVALLLWLPVRRWDLLLTLLTVWSIALQSTSLSLCVICILSHRNQSVQSVVRPIVPHLTSSSSNYHLIVQLVSTIYLTKVMVYCQSHCLSLWLSLSRVWEIWFSCSGIWNAWVLFCTFFHVHHHHHHLFVHKKCSIKWHNVKLANETCKARWELLKQPRSYYNIARDKNNDTQKYTHILHIKKP